MIELLVGKLSMVGIETATRVDSDRKEAVVVRCCLVGTFRGNIVEYEQYSVMLIQLQ